MSYFPTEFPTKIVVPVEAPITWLGKDVKPVEFKRKRGGVTVMAALKDGYWFFKLPGYAALLRVPERWGLRQGESGEIFDFVPQVERCACCGMALRDVRLVQYDGTYTHLCQRCQSVLLG